MLLEGRQMYECFSYGKEKYTKRGTHEGYCT